MPCLLNHILLQQSVARCSQSGKWYFTKQGEILWMLTITFISASYVMHN